MARAALLHQQQHAQRRTAAEEGGRQERYAEPRRPKRRLRQKARDRRADDEADVEGHADARHLARPLLRLGDIGDIALHHRAVAGEHAAEQSDHERRIDVRRERHQPVADAVAGEGREQHRLAPDPVRQPTPERLTDEGADRIGREDQRHLPRRRVKRRRIEGQERDHHPKAHQVHEDDEEQGRQSRRRRSRRAFGGGCGHLNGDKRRGGRRQPAFRHKRTKNGGRRPAATVHAPIRIASPLGGEDHDHLLAFHARLVLDLGHRLEIGLHLSASSFMPSSGCASSRPRKRRVTFTLSPSSKKPCMALAFTS